jgi:hypothetical protein
MRIPLLNRLPRRAAGLLLVQAVASAFAADLPRGTHAFASVPEAPAPAYLRVVEPDADTMRLEIAARKFIPVNRQGPAVWLTAVAHLGESNYFRALQRHLDDQGLVLFEGVKQASGGSESDGIMEPDDDSLQATLARALGLAFQLKAIDYQRPHFRNSDLSITELQQCLKENLGDSPDDTGTAELSALLALMDGRSFLSGVVKLGVRLLGSHPRLQALTKVAMIEAIGQLRGDLSHVQGSSPGMKRLLEAIIQRRNQAVLKDLRTALNQRPPARSISIFYGAAHMPDFDKRLRQDLAYRPAEEVWFKAISVQPGQAGVSRVELDFVRSLVRAQMRELLKEPTH